ncbi:MAG: O-antigen ligase family protein [bacterium]|nr:O-antigen ligase family protein [bacterium]
MLLIITFILFSLGQLGRISFFNQEINIYVYELFIFLQLSIFVYKYKLKPLVLNKSKTSLIYPVFFIWMIFTYVISIFHYSFHENLVALLYLSRLFFYFIWGVFSLYDLKKYKRNLRNMLIGNRIMISLIIIFSLIQFFFYNDLANLRYLGWDVHLNRLFSVFLDTSISGSVIGLLFYFVLLSGKQFIVNTKIRYMLLGILMFTGILTFSRNFYIAFILSILIYYIFHRNIKIAIISIIVFVFLLILAPKQFGMGVGLTRIFTIQSRLSEYNKAFEITKKNPVFGVGYNRIRYIKENVPAFELRNSIPVHSAANFTSSFLTILVSTGIVGLFLFILSLVKIGSMNSFAMISIIFVSLMSFGDNILLHPFILFLLVCGITSFNFPSDTGW